MIVSLLHARGNLPFRFTLPLEHCPVARSVCRHPVQACPPVDCHHKDSRGCLWNPVLTQVRLVEHMVIKVKTHTVTVAFSLGWKVGKVLKILSSIAAENSDGKATTTTRGNDSYLFPLARGRHTPPIHTKDISPIYRQKTFPVPV